MASGKIKWWDNKKGFGFIAQDAGQDVFVHHTAILGSGFKVLNEGDEVGIHMGGGMLGGSDEHHLAEGVLKGFVRAVDQGCQVDLGGEGMSGKKGVLWRFWICDFGFWIFSFLASSNPKSKIQNLK